MRMTRQRRLLLGELRSCHGHPTADDLYAALRRKMPSISLGTVYRNLEVLSQAGLIRRLDLGGGQMRFDGRLDRHDHLRCVQCGAIRDLEGKSLAHLMAEVDAHGFKILGYTLEFEGICRACRMRLEPETTRKGKATEEWNSKEARPRQT